MDAIAAVASLIQSFVASVIGARLLWIGIRKKATLEIVIGLSWLSSAGANIAWLATAVADPGSTTRDFMSLATRVLSALGAALVLAVCWWIFRRRSSWAIGFCILVLVAFAAGVVQGTQGSLNPIYVWSRALPYLWLAVESFLEQNRLRKRLRYGLEPDGTLAHQLLFLGLATAAGALSYIAIATWDLHYRPLPVRELTATFSLISAVFSWLAFLTPQRYLQSLRRSTSGVR